MRHRIVQLSTGRSSIRTASFLSDGLESWYFDCLAIASKCRKHMSKAIRPHSSFAGRTTTVFHNRKYHHSASSQWQEPDSTRTVEVDDQPNHTKEELLALVDQYNGESYTDQLPLLELPRLYQPGNGPYLTVSDKREDEWPPRYYAWPADPKTRIKIELLIEALMELDIDLEKVFHLYRELPSPRVPYLEAETRHRLLHHLSLVEKKDEHSMMRYFSVVDDMKETAIPLLVSEWTSAISFAARYVRKSTELEVEAALHLWKEMENVAGVRANEATFNVLYDVACKAGKFTLAEMIYNEMTGRGLEFNRYHHVSKIYLCGLKGDGEGARAAYEELVEDSEMVDTVVLNAMVSALIRSHESHAAENVYYRMKMMYMKDASVKLPPRDYMSTRKISNTLVALGKKAKKMPSLKESFQQNVATAPDMQTYRILINHFAVEAGDLDKTAKFLDEMRLFEIPVHGALFLALFKGFARHGGIRYTKWTDERLEKVFKAFIDAIDDEVEDLFVSRWIVIWSLEAFAKCSGRSRTLQAWEQLEQRWDLSEMSRDHVLTALRSILDEADKAERRLDSDWINRPAQS